MSADTEQVGGQHYKKCPPQYQHWNLVHIHEWDYFQAQIIKYVMRWRDKDGVEALHKARHFLDKYIELNTPLAPEDTSAAEKYAITVEAHLFAPGQVNPSGWVAFRYEGASDEGDLFQCKQCMQRFAVPVGTSPHTGHDLQCPAQPAPHGYVDQD